MTHKSSDHKKHGGRKCLPLSELKKGESGRVVRVLTIDPEVLKRFAAMGLFPGVSVKLLQKSPSYLFQVARSQFAADKELMSQVEIEVAG